MPVRNINNLSLLYNQWNHHNVITRTFDNNNLQAIGQFN